jgi:hypothetical protein
MNFTDLFRKIKEADSPSTPVTECGQMPAPMPAPMPARQEDSVSINVNMSGQGTGGIRDLLNVLKDLQSPATNIPAKPGMLSKPPLGKSPILGAEDFANSPDEKVAPLSAVTPTGDDLHSKGKEAPKVNGGGNPMSIAAKLENLYNSIKSR